jgi:hypothetical protein
VDVERERQAVKAVAAAKHGTGAVEGMGALRDAVGAGKLWEWKGWATDRQSYMDVV